MKLIAGWLRARGVFPRDAENPTEAQVLDSLEAPFASTAGEVSASVNEYSILTGQITTSDPDSDAKKNPADQNATALSNEQLGAQG